ncbi:myelin-associated glycoprotein-like isoform X2 [Triplophysa rosa]|nr:myelin-associated glycoprotein-like isoform X2 [Triplophysa rosa]
MPKEIHGLKGSCLVIPCSFYYLSNPPTNPERVVWYQWVSKGYPLVYDPWYPSYIIDKFREKTSLYGDPTNWSCSLLIERLDQSHHREKLYAWIDPENVGRGTYRFFDVTSTIHVDTDPKPPTIKLYGGERTGDDMTAACITYHSCPYSKPNITLKGIEGSDQITNDQLDVLIEDGLWKITLTRTGVVKAESSDIECTVTHYGGITTRATKNKQSACIYNYIIIEPNRADVVEGVPKDFTCTINHSCLKDPPSISWNYKNMQVSNGNKKLTEFNSATSSTVTFLAEKKDRGKKLICTAEFSGKNVQASVDLHVQYYETRLVDPEIKDTDRVYEANVVPRLTALPRSCVVIPCSFKMPEELAVRVWGRWIVRSTKRYMFHTGQRDVLDNFKGRTKLLGNPVDQDCTVEIDNVQNHDNGPFCFRAQTEQKEYLFNHSCVFIAMQALPDKPVMSLIPDDIEPGTHVTI